MGVGREGRVLVATRACWLVDVYVSLSDCTLVLGGLPSLAARPLGPPPPLLFDMSRSPPVGPGRAEPGAGRRRPAGPGWGRTQSESE